MWKRRNVGADVLLEIGGTARHEKYRLKKEIWDQRCNGQRGAESTSSEEKPLDAEDAGGLPSHRALMVAVRRRVHSSAITRMYDGTSKRNSGIDSNNRINFEHGAG